MGRDSSVGIATGYGLKGPGIESRRGGEIFRFCPDRLWGPSSLLHNGYRVSFQGVKRPGRGVGHPPSSSAEVKERVELNLYPPSGPHRACNGITLPLPNSKAIPLLPLLVVWPVQSLSACKRVHFTFTFTCFRH